MPDTLCVMYAHYTGRIARKVKKILTISLLLGDFQVDSGNSVSVLKNGQNAAMD